MAAKTILHSNTNTHGEYHGIDIIKFFCSYLICMVHIAPFVRGTPLFDNLNFYIQNNTLQKLRLLYLKVLNFHLL